MPNGLYVAAQYHENGSVSVRKHNAPFQRATMGVWCVTGPHRWPRIAFGPAPASRLMVAR